MVTTNNIPAQKAIEHLLHATALKKLALDPLDLLNMAGEHFVNVRPWRWLKGANAFLDSRGNISITNGTWTESSKTLTSSGAFTNYTFIDGDHVKVTGGTSAILKTIEIASRTSNNAIVLKESLASTSGDLSGGDIAATLQLPTLELPDDCGHITSISGSTSVVNSVSLVDHKELNMLRSQYSREDDTGGYQAAVIYVGTPPRPVLDVHPDFSSSSQDVFRIYYLRNWKRITEAADTLPIPRFCNGAYMQLCRHFALGWEDEDELGLEERLARWEMGPLLVAAAKEDGRSQQEWGRMRGGAVRRTRGPVGPNALSSEVAGPS